MAKTIRTATALVALLAGAAVARAEVPAPAPTNEPAKSGGDGAASPPRKSDAPSAAAESDAAKSAPAPPTDAGPSAPSGPETPAWEKAPATRRAGFSVGVLLGGGAGNVTGYPADIEKRNKDAFRTDMGATFGGGATLWLGGALTDWLVFGLGAGGAVYQGGGARIEGFTFVFHTEVFPLFWVGGPWRDLGIAFDTGAGSFTGELVEKTSELVAPVIESGAASRVGASLFYDGLRAWKVSAGPFVGFDYTWSATLTQPIVMIGWRTALYAKAPSPSAGAK